MKIQYILIVFLLYSAKNMGQNIDFVWNKLIPVPKELGNMSKGVSGAFAGVIGEYVVLAGGCNFPDIPVTEGGKKQYYDDVLIYRETPEKSEWLKIGKLPTPTAYGVALNIDSGIICIGGNDGEHALNTAYQLSINGNNVKQLPSLPHSVDNMAGTVIDSVIYIVGGNVAGKPFDELWALNLRETDKGWIQKQTFPGGKRLQAVVVSQQINNEKMVNKKFRVL